MTEPEWEFGFVLACGHYEGQGTYTSLVECERITPRRKDRSFAAAFCHVCSRKRRISQTIASRDFTREMRAP